MSSSRWRIEESKRGPRVILTLGGVDHVLTAAEAFALLKAAPKMAGPWEVSCSQGCCHRRVSVDGYQPAIVTEGNAQASYDWSVDSDDAFAEGTESTLDAAKAAADETLIAAGYLMADEAPHG